MYGQGLTVRLTLPEGYFVGASSNLDYWSIAKIAISFVFVIIAFALWIRNRKDDKVIDTLEFYPPEDFNSADIGFLYKDSSFIPSISKIPLLLSMTTTPPLKSWRFWPIPP